MPFASSPPPPQPFSTGASYWEESERASLGQAQGYSALADDGSLSAEGREAARLVSLAEEQLDGGRPDEAAQTASAALGLFRELKHTDGVIGALRIILHCYTVEDQVQEAWNVVTDELASFCASGDKRGVAAATTALAEVELKDRRFEDAARSATDACKAADEAGDMRLQAGATLVLADVALECREFQKAVTLGQRAEELCQRATDWRGAAQALQRVADAHLASGALESALRAAEQARGGLQEVGDRKGEGAALLNLARIFSAMGHLADAVRVAQEALAAFRQCGDTAGQRSALRDAVAACIAHGDAQQAVRVARDVLADFAEREDVRGQVAALEAVHDASVARGEFQEAAEAASAALALSRDFDLRREEASLSLAVALDHVKRKELDKASEGLKHAQALFQELGLRKGEAATLVGMAHLHLAEGALVAALDAAEEARATFLEVREVQRAANATLLKAFALRAGGKYDDAAAAALEAKGIFQDVGDHLGEANAWLSVAELRLENREKDKALVAARQARALAQDLPDRQRGTVVVDALRLMAAVHMESDDVDEAVRLLKEAEALAKRGGTHREQAQMKVLTAQIYRDRLYRRPEAGGEGKSKGSRAIKWLYEVTLRKAQGAVKLARSAEDPPLLAAALQTLGYVYCFEYRTEEAEAVAEESLGLYRDLGDRSGEAYTLALLAQALLQREDRAGAQRLLDDAISLAKVAGDEQCVAHVQELAAAVSSEPQAAPVSAPAAHATAPAPTGLPALVEVVEASVAQDLFRGPDPEAVRKLITQMVENMIGESDAIDDDTPLMESGVDSLAAVELRTQLQHEFHVSLPSTAMFNYPTVGALTDLLVGEMVQKKVAWSR